MGKKYIIKLEEPEIFDERKFYTCTQMPWWALSEDIVANLTPYTAPDLEQIRKEAYKDGYDAGFGRKIDASYQEGLSDAWEAVKKLARMDTDTSESITGYFGLHNIMHNLTASEVIEKIRKYEQEQDAEIKVGDEVTPRETEYDDMIVTRLWKDDYDSDCIDAIGFDGRIGSFLVSRVSKTGKHYEIAEVLEKMREESNG